MNFCLLKSNMGDIFRADNCVAFVILFTNRVVVLGLWFTT